MKKVVWLLLDDRMGSVSQAKGVAQALDATKFEVVEKKIEYNFFAGLPNCLKGASLLGVRSWSREALVAPFPDLVISASRRTATVARYLKQKSCGRTKIVQILHPGNAIDDFDFIFLPEHDRHKKSNEKTFFVVGSPHKVTEKTLKEAKEKWQKTFDTLPKPLTALIVGGSIKKKPFTLENAATLVKEVKNFMVGKKGSLLITDSKRTGKEPRELILDALKDIPSYKFVWGDTGENPYLGYLACADNLIVTGDSVSMCSEACGSGKPVYIFSGENWLSPKHYRFMHSLIQNGYAMKLENAEQNFTPREKLNSAKQIADKISESFF